ncbi:MAG TPA: PilW family protein, partial [Cellvibrionaceae bacterium]
HIEATAGAPPGVTLAPAPNGDSPVLAIRTANGAGVRVTQETTAVAINVEDLGEIGGCPSGLCANDILMISDCAKARVFQSTAVNSGADVTIEHSGGANPGNSFGSWGGSDPTPYDIYRVGAEVTKIHTLLYYIADNPRGRPSLYLQEGNTPGGAIELLEGVEAMNLEFGVGSQSVVTEFVPFSAGVNWNNVLAVRLSLLVQSTDDNISPEPQTYTFAGEDVEADDRRIRQVFTTTVGIRSRLN